MNAWTRERIAALGPITDVPTTAAICEVNPDTIYASIRRDEWKLTRVLRIGRKIKIPTLDLIQLLYGAETAPAPSLDGSEQQCENGPRNRSSEALQPHTQCGCRVGESAVIRTLRGT